MHDTNRHLYCTVRVVRALYSTLGRQGLHYNNPKTAESKPEETTRTHQTKVANI